MACWWTCHFVSLHAHQFLQPSFHPLLLPQVCDENGSPLPMDQQLLWPPESCLLHQFPAAGSTGLLTRCHHIRYDNVHTALWEGQCHLLLIIFHCQPLLPRAIILCACLCCFAADIIWLEYCEDWHECCATVPAPHALQYACLCCHTVCLRLGTGHHYCRWHAFLYTGQFFITASLRIE